MKGTADPEIFSQLVACLSKKFTDMYTLLLKDCHPASDVYVLGGATTVSFDVAHKTLH